MIERIRTQLDSLPAATALALTLGLALLPGAATLLVMLALGDSVTALALLALGLIAAGAAGCWFFWRDRLGGTVENVQSPDADNHSDLIELSTRLHVTADGVVRAAQAVADVAYQQSDGANEQAEVIRLTNTMMEDFLNLSERVNEQARRMTETAQETTEISDGGQVAIQQAIQGMTEIRRQVMAIAATISTLAQFTRRIDQIITSVSEIATQSNLLALNASIEAARAGAQGRGFAVVADEVRSLSQQSTVAAQQVRAILVEIQAAVKEAIEATEVGMDGLESGLSMTQKADRIMMQLAESVTSSHHGVRAIYEVIRQQVEGLEGISINMERIDRIAQQNLTGARLTTTIADNLARLADELQRTVDVGKDLSGDSGPPPPKAMKRAQDAI